MKNPMLCAPSLSFSRAAAADLEAVRQLVHAAYVKWIAVIGREPLPMQTDYAKAIARHDLRLLHHDGVLVGLIELIPAVDHLFVENVAVAPAHQGRGYGRMLLAEAERAGRAQGAKELRLLTNAKFEANVSLYRHMGYRLDRMEAFLGGSTVFMSRPLVA